MAERPDPVIKPLRITLGLLGATLLVTLIATGVSGCHHAGWM